MSGDQPSEQTIHASCVAADGRAVLISGPSGAGKSDLALRLIDRGFALVSDDQTMLRRADGRLIASAPATIAGKIEVRGIGIVEMPAIGDVPVGLFVDLTDTIERLPDSGAERTLLGVPIPIVAIDAQTASAAVKVELALGRSLVAPQ